MDETESIFPQLEISDFIENIIEIKEAELKANELHSVLKTINQQIENVAQEVEDLRSKEAVLQAKIKLKSEQLCVLMQTVKNAQNKYDALVNTRKDYLANYCGHFKHEADVTTSLGNNMMDLLDLKIKVDHIEDDIWEIKLLLLENKEITLHFNIRERIFHLQSMEPTHPRFNDLKLFLCDSSDITGFLYYARLFYLNNK